MIVKLVITVRTLSAFASDEKVNEKVWNAFKTEFNTAKEVEWTVGANFYRATFNYNGRYVFAFYNENGELFGLARYISPVDLPLVLQNELRKNYEGYWVADLFESSKNDNTNYVITLENADTKVVLKSSGNSWDIYNRVKKS